MGFKTKIKKSSPRAFNAWLLFVTILGIALFFLFYSLVFIKNNTEERIGKRFRVLTQMGKNVVERERGFRSIAANVEKGAEEKVKQKIYDSLKKAVNEEILITNKLLKAAALNSREVRDKCIITFGEMNIEGSPYIIYMDVKDFFAPLFRPDMFQEMIILQGHDKSSEDVPGGCPGNVIYHTFPGDINTLDLTEDKEAGNINRISPIMEMLIADKKYKLFLQPVKLSGGKRWFLGGAIDIETFTAESRKLKHGAATPYFIIFAIFLLSIPLLKLVLLSTFERLDAGDAILTGLSVILGVIALVILYLFIYQTGRDGASVEQDLCSLAEQVEIKMSKELSAAYNQMEKYDESLMGYSLKKGDRIENLLTGARVFSSADILAIPLSNLVWWLRLFNMDYDLFKSLFWIDAKGWQVLQFSTRKYGGTLINVGSRTYFQEAGNWNLPGNPRKKFMLQSITSMTSGEQLAAISKYSSLSLVDKDGTQLKPKVVAMTMQPISLINTVLPEGYGFCIIDASGKVWFHSDTKRNLQENFIHEVGDDQTLISALNSKQAKIMELQYQDVNHKCFAKPLSEIPLYIVTFHNMRYTTVTHTSTMIHTLFLILPLILFHIFLFGVIARGNYRKSQLKRKFVPFAWFRPSPQKRGVYRQLIETNVYIGAILLVFMVLKPGKGGDPFFFCWAAALFSFLYNYYSLTCEDSVRYPFSPFSQMVLFLSLLAFINWMALRLMEEFFVFLFFQGLVLLGLALLRGINTRRSFRILDGWKQGYLYFLLTWLVLACVIPAVIFFIHAYNFESSISIRSGQVELAESIENRNLLIDRFYNETMEPPHHEYVSNLKWKRKNCGIYAENIDHTKIDDIEGYGKAQPIPDTPFNRIAYLFKTPYNPMTVERRDLVFPAAADKSRIWRKSNHKIYLRYKIEKSLFNENGLQQNYIYISSMVPYFRVPGGYSLIFFLIPLGLIVVSAYYLLRFFTRTIYGLSLFELYGEEVKGIQPFEEIREKVRLGTHMILHCPSPYELEYYSGLFGSGTESKGKSRKEQSLKTGQETIPAYFFDVETEDLEKSSIMKTKYSRVLIENFQIYDYDMDGTIEKLEKISSLLRLNRFQLILPLFVPLRDLNEYYREKCERLSNGGGSSAVDKESIQKYRELNRLLERICNEMTFIYLPIKKGDIENAGYEKSEEITTTRDLSKKEHLLSEHLRYIAKKELEPADFLKTLERTVNGYCYRLKKYNALIGEEKMILKVQESARNYYKNILNSCSRREKYILRDIAEDMLVNTGDKETIGQLLKKGLIVKDGTFRLMNESFRNHLLESRDEGEGEYEFFTGERALKWKSYKTPLLLIALGAAVFFAFQEDWLGKVDAIITTVVGAIAIITKFSGLFSGIIQGKK